MADEYIFVTIVAALGYCAWTLSLAFFVLFLVVMVKRRSYLQRHEGEFGVPGAAAPAKPWYMSDLLLGIFYGIFGLQLGVAAVGMFIDYEPVMELYQVSKGGIPLGFVWREDPTTVVWSLAILLVSIILRGISVTLTYF